MVMIWKIYASVSGRVQPKRTGLFNMRGDVKEAKRQQQKARELLDMQHERELRQPDANSETKICPACAETVRLRPSSASTAARHSIRCRGGYWNWRQKGWAASAATHAAGTRCAGRLHCTVGINENLGHSRGQPAGLRRGVHGLPVVIRARHRHLETMLPGDARSPRDTRCVEDRRL